MDSDEIYQFHSADTQLNLPSIQHYEKLPTDEQLIEHTLVLTIELMMSLKKMGYTSPDLYNFLANHMGDVKFQLWQLHNLLRKVSGK